MAVMHTEGEASGQPLSIATTAADTALEAIGAFLRNQRMSGVPLSNIPVKAIADVLDVDTTPFSRSPTTKTKRQASEETRDGSSTLAGAVKVLKQQPPLRELRAGNNLRNNKSARLEVCINHLRHLAHRTPPCTMADCMGPNRLHIHSTDSRYRSLVCRRFRASGRPSKARYIYPTHLLDSRDLSDDLPPLPTELASNGHFAQYPLPSDPPPPPPPEPDPEINPRTSRFQDQDDLNWAHSVFPGVLTTLNEDRTVVPIDVADGS